MICNSVVFEFQQSYSIFPTTQKMHVNLNDYRRAYMILEYNFVLLEDLSELVGLNIAAFQISQFVSTLMNIESLYSE